MKKYLVFFTLTILFFLFGCEEESAFHLHTAPEYYQGRALLPSGQQIELTESDRSLVLNACEPEAALKELPSGTRHLIGTVTLTQPLTTNPLIPAFPTATFFEVENHLYVQCQSDAFTYMKQVENLPESLSSFRDRSVSYPSEAKLRNAQPREQLHFLEEMNKPIGNEPYYKRSAFEETLVHLTVPFNGSFEFTFQTPDKTEHVSLPIDPASRKSYLSLGFGIESVKGKKMYGLYTSYNQELYQNVIRPQHASFNQLLGAFQTNMLPSTLVPNERYPILSFSYIRDGRPYKEVVFITYKEVALISGKELENRMHEDFLNRRHAILHDLALIGTESRDESFLKHTNSNETDFIFKAIDRAKPTPVSGEPAATPYLTIFEGISVQTFDVSHKGKSVLLTNTKTGSHFELLREDAQRWHTLFSE